MSSFLLGVPGKLKVLLDRLTAARAAYLDNLVLLAPPVGTPIVPAKTRTTWVANDYAILKENTGGASVTSTSSSLTDVVTVTGQGILQLAVFGGASYTPGSNTFEVEIDGSVISYATTLGAEPTVAVGSIHHTNNIATFEALPFKSSLIIRLKSNGSLTQTCVYKYRLTA